MQQAISALLSVAGQRTAPAAPAPQLQPSAFSAAAPSKGAANENKADSAVKENPTASVFFTLQSDTVDVNITAADQDNTELPVLTKKFAASSFFTLHGDAATTNSSLLLLPTSSSLDDDIPGRALVSNSQDNICTKISEADSSGSVKLSQTCATNIGSGSVNSSDNSNSITSSSSLSNTASTSSNTSNNTSSSTSSAAVAPPVSLFLSCEDFCKLDKSFTDDPVENKPTPEEPEEKKKVEAPADEAEKKTGVDKSGSEIEEDSPDSKPSAGFGSSADKKFTLPPLSTAHENAFWVQTLERSGACTVLSQTSADIAAKAAPVKIPPDFGKSFNAVSTAKKTGRSSRRANSVDSFAGAIKKSGGTPGSSIRTFGSSAKLQQRRQAAQRRIVDANSRKGATSPGEGQHSTFQADSASSIVSSQHSVEDIRQRDTSVRFGHCDVAAIPVSTKFTCYSKNDVSVPLAAGATIAGSPNSSGVLRALFHRASREPEKRPSVITARLGEVVPREAEALRRLEEDFTRDVSHERLTSTTSVGTAASALGEIGLCRALLLQPKNSASAAARSVAPAAAAAEVSRAKQRTALKLPSHLRRTKGGTDKDVSEVPLSLHGVSPYTVTSAQSAAGIVAEEAEGAAAEKSAAVLLREVAADEKAVTTASPSGFDSSTIKASTSAREYRGEQTGSTVWSFFTLKQQSKEFVQQRYQQAKSLLFTSSPFAFTHSSTVSGSKTFTAVPIAAEAANLPERTTAVASSTTPAPFTTPLEATLEEATETAEITEEINICSLLPGTPEETSIADGTAANSESDKEKALEEENQQPVAAAATPPSQETTSNEDDSLKNKADQPASASAEPSLQEADTNAPVPPEVKQLSQRYCFRALTPPCHLCSSYSMKAYAKQQQQYSTSKKTMQFTLDKSLYGVGIYPQYPAGPGWITPPFSPRYSPVQQLHQAQPLIHRQQIQQQLPIASPLPVSAVGRREFMGILPPMGAARTTPRHIDIARGTSNSSNSDWQKVRENDASRRYTSECHRSRAVSSPRMVGVARSPALRPGSVDTRQKSAQQSPKVGRRPRSVTPSPAVWRSRSPTAARGGALALTGQRQSRRMLLVDEKDDLQISLRGRGSSRGPSQRLCNGARAPPIMCHACGVITVPSQHSKESSSGAAISANSDSTKTPPLCSPCREKKEILRWKQITDWRSIINEVGFLSLQKHYKYELPNQHDSAAFSLHNKVEKRVFFAIMHTNEPASSHLPVGWRMFLYLPNPAVQKDLLNVLDPKSEDAFTVIRADRPCGQSLLSYVTRTPIVVWESLHDRAIKSYKQKLLGYIIVSRSPFVSLRVQNSQRHKVVEVFRLKKGSKKRRTPQEWMAYGLNREVPVARIVLFMDECKSIAGRDATIVFDDRVEATLKMFIVVCVCYIQFLSFGRCAGVKI